MDSATAVIEAMVGAVATAIEEVVADAIAIATEIAATAGSSQAWRTPLGRAASDGNFVPNAERWPNRKAGRRRCSNRVRCAPSNA